MPTEDKTQTTHPPRTRRVAVVIGWEIAVAALAMVLVPASGLLVMGSDNCVSGLDDRFICTVTGQWTAALLPPVGVLLALLMIGVGGGIASWRHRPVGSWIAAGIGALAAATFVGWSIASVEVSDATRQRETDALAAESAREHAEFGAGLRSHPDAEVQQAQFGQIQHDLARQVPAAPTHPAWPETLRQPDSEQSCRDGQSQAVKIDAEGEIGQVAPAQWTDLHTVLDTRLRAEGFAEMPPAPPSDWRPQTMMWSHPDGAMLVANRYRATPLVQVHYRTPCSVRSTDRASLPR